MRTRNHSGGLILCARALGRVHEQEVRSPLAHPASPAFAAIHYVHGAARPAAMGKGVQPRPPFADHPPDLRHPVLILPASQRTTVATFARKQRRASRTTCRPRCRPRAMGGAAVKPNLHRSRGLRHPGRARGRATRGGDRGWDCRAKISCKARHARCCCDANATLGSAGTAASQALAVGSQRPH